MDKRINIEDELLPCPFCKRKPRLVDLAGWEILCKCGVSLCLDGPEKAPLVAHWNSRTPPATGETEDLPPLPEEELLCGNPNIGDDITGYTAEQYQQGQREAIAHYLRKQACQVGDEPTNTGEAGS